MKDRYHPTEYDGNFASALVPYLILGSIGSAEELFNSWSMWSICGNNVYSWSLWSICGNNVLNLCHFYPLSFKIKDSHSRCLNHYFRYVNNEGVNETVRIVIMIQLNVLNHFRN